MAAEIGAATDDRPAAPPDLPIVVRAGRVLLVAAALGAAGQLLLFGVGAGVNIPIAVALLVAAGWASRRRDPGFLDAWLGPGAIAFAGFAAIRADPSLVALDILTALGLTGGALASYGGRPVVSRGFGALIGLGAAALGWVAAGAIVAMSAARRSLPSSRTALGQAAPALPVLRGLAIAVPVLLVFAALFASADAVFARILDDVFAVELDLGDAGGRIITATVIAWFAAGGLALAASVPRANASHVGVAPPRIGTTELATVLTAVAALFVAFVGLQAAYLFGGLDTLKAVGVTYADYARRGFFELVAVAFLAGGLIIAAERLATRRSRWLVSAAIGLAVLTGVVLVSAAMRLRLYQDAYGWTELRLYVLATIVLLGVGLVALVAALATDRVRWIGHVLLVAGLTTGLVLNVIGPVRFITEQNVARVLQPDLVPPNGSSGLDTSYLAGLGDDAVPSLLRVLPVLDAEEMEYLREELSVRLITLRNDDGLNAWQAWNAGRAAAKDALEAAAAAGELP